MEGGRLARACEVAFLSSRTRTTVSLGISRMIGSQQWAAVPGLSIALRLAPDSHENFRRSICHLRFNKTPNRGVHQTGSSSMRDFLEVVALALRRGTQSSSARWSGSKRQWSLDHGISFRRSRNNLPSVTRIAPRNGCACTDLSEVHCFCNDRRLRRSGNARVCALLDDVRSLPAGLTAIEFNDAQASPCSKR